MTNSELLMTNAVCTTTPSSAELSATPLVTQPTTSVPLSAPSQDCNTSDLTNNTNNACIGEKITALDKECNKTNSRLLQKTNEACAIEEKATIENNCITTNSELLRVVNAACTPTPSTPSAAPSATPATAPSAVPSAVPSAAPSATIEEKLQIFAKEEKDKIDELEKLTNKIIQTYDEENKQYIAYIFEYLKGKDSESMPILAIASSIFSSNNINIIKNEHDTFNHLRIILMNTIVVATYKIQGQGLKNNMIMDTNEHMKSISEKYLNNFSRGVTITTEKIDLSLLYSIFQVLHKIISTYNYLRDKIYKVTADTVGELNEEQLLIYLNTIVDCIKNIIINANNDITLLYLHNKLDNPNMGVFIEENRIINQLCDDYINEIKGNKKLYEINNAIYKLYTRTTGASLIVRYKLIIHSNVRDVENDIPSLWDWGSIEKIGILDKDMYCLLMNIIIALFIGDKNSDKMTYVDNLKTLKEKYNNLDNLDTIYETQIIALRNELNKKWDVKVILRIFEIIEGLNTLLEKNKATRQQVLVHIKNIIIQSNSDIPFINSNSYNDIFLNKYNNIKQQIMKEISSTHNSDYRNCGIITWGLGMINNRITGNVLKELFKEVTIGKNFNELFNWIFEENMINQYYCVILIYIILTSLFEVENIRDTDYINNSEGRIDDIKNRKIMNLVKIRDDKVLIKSILKLFSILQASYNSLAHGEKKNETNPINYIITETLIAINNNIIYLNLSNQSLMNTFASYNDNRLADITKMINETEEDTYSQQKYLFHSGRSGLVAYGLVKINEESKEHITEETKNQINNIFDNIFKYNIINHDECVVLMVVILASLFTVEGIAKEDHITIYAPITKEIALKYYKNIKIVNNSIRDLTFLSSILSLLTKLIELYIEKKETKLIKEWIIQTIKKAINHITVLYSNSLIDNPDEITKRVASYNSISKIIINTVASTDIIKVLTYNFKNFNQLETNKTINKYLKYKIKYLNIKKKLVNII
jgi:hypothetical protein